jgi:murein DD-endopeptidase MepM/ murein hydrolase activator NlpD
VRATSLPPALPVAAAAIPLMAAVLVPLAVPSAALAERWLRPVPGEVARSFSYARATPFAAGAHRGADLAARAGAPVRSACAGTVVHAGPVAGQGRVVSVRCGSRRVSYLPLARVTVRAGAPMRAGTKIGTVAAGHGGLHLGVRREDDRFAYEDPIALLSAREPPAPPTGVPRARPALPGQVRVRSRRPAGPPRVTPRSDPQQPHTEPLRPPAHREPTPPLAPLPVWLGLGLLLTGAAGSGTVVARRRRRLPSRAVVVAVEPRR